MVTTKRAATGAKVVIDKEFAALIPHIASEELAQLETNLLADGCLDPLIVWDQGVRFVLLDGHNRHKLCNKHGISHRLHKMTFEDRNAARNWIINHQLGRRNITDEQRRYLLGKLYLEKKPAQGRPNKPETVSGLSAEAVAEDHGVTERTVRNAADFAETVDAIGEKSPELKDAILAGDVKASASDLEALAEAPKSEVKAVAREVAEGNKQAIKEAVAEDDEPEAKTTDPNGVAIPKKFQEVFAAQADFRSIVQQLGKALSAADELRKTPAGTFLNESFERIKADIGNAQRALKFAMPHQVCPYCKGKGCTRKGAEKTPCRQTGWTVKGIKGTGE